MSPIPATLDPNIGLRNLIYQSGSEIGVFSPEDYPQTANNETPIRKKRRIRGDADDEDPRLAMTLTEVDGVLRWHDGYGYRSGTGLRRSRMSLGVEGDIIAPINFEKLAPSKIGEYLKALDGKLTPHSNFHTPELGMRQLVKGEWQDPGTKPVEVGRILLFIHGTFSKSEMYVEELTRTPEGKDLLGRIQSKKNYDQVLAFDHATLALSPILNAMDLARIFVNSRADVDVICHSRGGLVARWWLERYDSRARGSSRAVLVGSPLAGTSLAAAPRLRAAVNLLTNIARVLEKAGSLASTAFPIFTVVTGLLRVIASAGTIASKTPAFDAAVALIPGLLGQAMVSNNEELNRLNRDCTTTLNYFAVRSDFKPSDPGWEFWKYFVNVGDRAKDWAADLVFENANDLVVDTASMTVLAKPPQAVSVEKIHDFGQNSKVHHTVYFRQPETAEFIVQCLGLKPR
jgi:pimeloyl-ACP methyl ester carboxylesterase